jgi:hypothetical protein
MASLPELLRKDLVSSCAPKRTAKFCVALLDQIGRSDRGLALPRDQVAANRAVLPTAVACDERLLRVDSGGSIVVLRTAAIGAKASSDLRRAIMPHGTSL